MNEQITQYKRRAADAEQETQRQVDDLKKAHAAVIGDMEQTKND